MNDTQIDRLVAGLERIAVALERSTPISTVKLDTNNQPITTAMLTPIMDPVTLTDVAGPVIAYDTVRLAVLTYSDTHGTVAAEAILKRFGAKYIKDLKADPSQYGAVLDALK
jgi:hypothetical protein